MSVVEKKSFCRICGAGCGIIVEVDGEELVKVNADRDHGLTAGYTCPKGRALQVRSRHGEVRGVMAVDKTLRKGALNVPHGWSGAFNVNNLTGTRGDVDPVTGMVRYSGLSVSIHAA